MGEAHDPAVVVGLGVSGVEAQGRVVVGKGSLQVARGVPGHAAVGVGDVVGRIDAQRVLPERERVPPDGGLPDGENAERDQRRRARRPREAPVRERGTVDGGGDQHRSG